MGVASRSKWEKKVARARLEGEMLAIPPKTRWEQAWSWSSVGAVVLACGGLGVSFMTSSHRNVADGFFCLTALLFVSKWWTWRDGEGTYDGRTVLINTSISITALAAICVACYWNHELNSPKPQVGTIAAKAPELSTPIAGLTVRKLYDQDSDNTVRLGSAEPNITFSHGKMQVRVNQATLEYSKSRTFVESFYIPKSPLTAEFLLSLATKGASVNKLMRKTVDSLQSKGDLPETPLPEQNVIFAGGYSFGNKIFFYHEDRVPLSVRAQAEKSLESQGISVEFRGPEYALAQLMYRIPKEP